MDLGVMHMSANTREMGYVNTIWRKPLLGSNMAVWSLPLGACDRMHYLSNEPRTSSLIGGPSANYAGGRRPQGTRHAPFALHGHSESRYPEAGPSRKFVLESREPLRPASDPRQPNFDVEARYGRGREERIQRKRKQDELEQDTSSLVTDKSRLDTAPVRQAEPATEYEDADAKFLAEIDKNSVAAKALRTAQDTLERKRAGKVKDRAKRDASPNHTGPLNQDPSAKQSTASQVR